MTKQLKLSALAAALLVSASAFAAKPGYLADVSTDSVVRNSYGECWKDSSFNKAANGLVECGDKVAAKPVVADAAKPKLVEVREKVTLSAKVLFNFDKATLTPAATGELDPLAARLKGDANLKSVEIDGYTDFLGSDKYNLTLSQQRADAVKNYFVNAGVDAGKIVAIGKGKDEAKMTDECKAQFKGKKLYAKLKDCLEPDRRVELDISTAKVSVVEQPAK